MDLSPTKSKILAIYVPDCMAMGLINCSDFRVVVGVLS
jgi:hypothetical protein